jgi:hypothetical protein
VCYSGWWWLTARQIAARANGWIAAEQAGGATISPIPIRVRGFPFSFRIQLEDARFSAADGRALAVQNIKLWAWPWSLSSVNVTAIGGFTVTIPAGSIRPTLTIAGETLRGAVTFDQSAVPSAAKLTADGVSASTPLADGKGGHEITAATIELIESRPSMPPATDMDVALDLSLTINDLSGRLLESNPLGGAINQVRVHARLLGPWPKVADEAGLKSWRDAGGTLDAPELELRWGMLALNGNGTLALDGAMQPQGAFTVRLTGYEQAIDALTAAGWIKMSAGGVAKIALGVASHPGPDGKPTVETPLTVQDRRLSLGPIKLAEIPVLKLD